MYSILGNFRRHSQIYITNLNKKYSSLLKKNSYKTTFNNFNKFTKTFSTLENQSNNISANSSSQIKIISDLKLLDEKSLNLANSIKITESCAKVK